MNRFLKTLLLWLLIAVVPLHAAAATIGMSCGPVHQKAMQATIAADIPHHELGGTTGHHHEAMDKFSSESGPTAVADTSSASAEKPHHSTCGVCSAFCMAAVAPPSAFISIPTFDGSETLVISPAPVVTGFIPAGLERPPRHISA